MKRSTGQAAAAIPGAGAGPAAFGRAEAALYATLVFVWGTSWIALHHQLGVVDPEVSLVWRFALSAAICFAVAIARGERLGFPAATHLRFLAAGLFMFSSNFVLFYHAGALVPSGLLAVVFALASPINLALGAAFFGRPIEQRVLFGAALGVCGVALLYAPQIAGAGFGAAAVLGLSLSVAGTLCFCVGNMISGAIQDRGVSDLAAMAWGMTYGTALLTALALALGERFIVEWTATYLGALLWLAVLSSVVAFLAYLALIKRIGPARAGFATVLFPVVALAISSVAEDFAWGPLSIAGIALVAAGNVVVLGLARRKA